MENLLSTVNPSADTNVSAKKRGPGRPPLDKGGLQIATVLRMSKLGIQQWKIAETIGISPKTLRKVFREQLDKGGLECNLTVLESLYDMASSQRNTAATIFWTKTRCADLLPDAQPKEAKPQVVSSSSDPAPATESLLRNFGVYNNEGEPNADY